MQNLRWSLHRPIYNISKSDREVKVAQIFNLRSQHGLRGKNSYVVLMSPGRVRLRQIV